MYNSRVAGTADALAVQQVVLRAGQHVVSRVVQQAVPRDRGSTSDGRKVPSSGMNRRMIYGDVNVSRARG